MSQQASRRRDVIPPNWGMSGGAPNVDDWAPYLSETFMNALNKTVPTTALGIAIAVLLSLTVLPAHTEAAHEVAHSAVSRS